MEKSTSKHRSVYLIASIIIVIITAASINRRYHRSFRPLGPAAAQNSAADASNLDQAVSPEIMGIIRRARS